MHVSRTRFSNSYMHDNFLAIYCQELFLRRLHVRYDTINRHLSPVFMYASVNVQAMLFVF